MVRWRESPFLWLVCDNFALSLPNLEEVHFKDIFKRKYDLSVFGMLNSVK